jgi:photosynthetic reaction center cytochrome c subunit
MKKSLLVTLGFAFMIVLSMAFTNGAPRYKNLKVLPKNTTKEQMDSIMHHFTVSLNVKCNFCHVRLEDEQKNWDFASDKNEHKLIARKMMQMTAKINKKYFEEDYKENKNFVPAMEVTCYTCHNGRVHPANSAAAANRPRPQQAAPRADSTRRQQ